MWIGTDGELGQMAGRLIGVAVGLTYAHFAEAQVSLVAERLANVRLLAYGYLAYLLVASAIVVRKRAVTPAIRYANTFADVNAVTAALYLGDAQVAPGVIYYLWAMAGNGFRYGARYLYFGQVLAIAGFTALLFVSDYWSTNWIGGVVIIIGCLLFLPLDFSVILQKLEDAKLAAESANQAKSNFLAVVSHEMRTPLSGILGMVELIRRTRLDVEQKTLLDTLARSAEVLLHLVTNVLDLAKIEAGKMPVQLTRFSYSELARTALSLFDFEAGRKGITLELVEQGAETPLMMHADPSLVRQVLLNLIGNAVKFTETGSIRVRLSCLAGAAHEVVRTEIQDTGIGMAPAFASRVFEAFTQADQSAARRHGGTGLGTTIAQQLVRLQGGAIGFSSTPGQGSLFWFELPLAHADELRTGQSPDSVQPLAIPSPATTWFARLQPCLNVLVVEDNETNRFVLSRMLTDAGHSVQTEADGISGLASLEQRMFDVVLIDMEMPGLSGTEVIARYKSQHPNTTRPAFIMLTAYTTAGVREAALACGASHFLTKPVKSEELLAAISQVRPLPPPAEAGASGITSAVQASVAVSALATREDRRFCDGLFSAFVADAQAALPKLETAINDLHWSQIAQHAHALRGAAADAGVRSIAEACRNIEQIAAAKAVEPLRKAWRDLLGQTIQITAIDASETQVSHS